MGDGFSLVDLSGLSQPVNTLIEKISDAIGAIYQPRQMVRLAKAQVKADRIKAIGEIELDDLKQKTLLRLLAEESVKQRNMDSIVAKAIPLIDENAKPQDIENDWISYFFDKSKIVSDEEMQTIWANILAEEANKPGTFSKRTINFMSSIDKEDAVKFTNLCGLCWSVDGESVPLIYDYENEVYQKAGVDFRILTHLDSIGLLIFQPLDEFLVKIKSDNIDFEYFGKKVIVSPPDNSKDINIGMAILTNTGKELNSIINAVDCPDVFDLTVKELRKKGLTCDLE